MAQQGLSSSGFQPLSLTEIQADLQAALQQAAGGTAVDLSSQSFWGQLIGIMANANSDLWQALAALYANSYPAGASGVALDNILAIAGLQRLAAKATVTNPSPATDSFGRVLHGLILQGAPGTVVPAGTLLSNGAPSPATFSLDNAATIGAASNEQQVIFFSNMPTSGSYSLTLTSPAGDALTTPAIAYNANLTATALSFTQYAAQTYRQFKLIFDGNKTTQNIGYGGTATFGGQTYVVAPLTASSLQNAINALPGYESVTVSGAPESQFFVSWNQASPAAITTSGDGAPDIITPSVSALISALSTANNVRPFTDIALSAEAQNVVILYGQNAPQAGMPATSASFVPLAQVTNSSLARGGAQTLASVTHRQIGTPAQAVGSATCTVPGATVVLVNQLTTIVNPVSGLSAVTNELDCLTGRDLETDAEAAQRLQSSRGNGASGSLAAILARVRAVAGVTQAQGFQNTSNAAQQVLQFATAPTQGQFNLLLGGQATSLLPFNASPADVQGAIAALPGFAATSVSASGSYGYLIEFNGEAGRQAQPLCQVPTNTTGINLAAYFGRGAHSIELVVQGGSDTDIATAILATLPAGIGTYSSPALRTVATMLQGDARLALATTTGVVPGQQILAPGVPFGASVYSVSGGIVTMTQSALQTASGVPVTFSFGSVLADAEGNNVSVSFSRAKTTIINIEVDLLTDLYNTPAQPSSGLNPAAKFSQSSVNAIQQGLIDLVNATPIGGTIVASGSNSLVGSFRSTPGILGVTIKFDRNSPPTNEGNLQLESNEAPLAESSTTAVNIS